MMKRAHTLDDLMSFLRNEEGATAIEYALIASVISIAIASSAVLIGQSLSGTFDEVAKSFPSATPAP
jgi:pilus assembly protein Flp/PilA